jgi:hypothetical protein
MKSLAFASCLIAVGAIATQLTAQDKAPCSLLTTPDVNAIGATGNGIPGEMPMGKGQTMKMCSWRMKQGGLHLSANRMPPGTSREVIENELTKTYQMLTAKGWKQDKRTFGNMSCTFFTPPAGDKESPTNTSCLTMVKGMMVNADVLSRTPVSMEKLKTLVDAATSRL